jgi:hypothetical protein
MFGWQQGKWKADDKEKREDQFHRLVFAFLRTFLPSVDGGSSFGATPPAAVVSMLVNNKVLDKAAELLR